MLKNTFESRDCELWSNLFKTYVRPHLEFAVAAWSPPNMAEIMILEKFQQRATRIPVKNFNLNYNERLNNMNLTTLELRIKRVDLIQFYKLINQVDALNLLNKPLSRDSLPSVVVHNRIGLL